MSQQEPFAHPGKILFEQVMRPLGVSRNKLAREIGVPVGRISDIVNGKRGITPDTALRLAKYFGTTAELWMRLQSDHDLFCARRDAWPRIEANVRVFSASDAGSELEALRADGRGSRAEAGLEGPSGDDCANEIHQPEQTAESTEVSPPGEPSELPGMGRILQFNAPDRSEDRPSPDVLAAGSGEPVDATVDKKEDLDEVTGNKTPTSRQPESRAVEEFDLEPESPENCLEIPDPNEFRFREDLANAGSAD